MILAVTIFVLLCGAHNLIDFSIQGDSVATGKNKFLDPAKYGVPWYYWMMGHAFSHGFAVAIITQSPIIGILETLFHFAVDWFKCKKLYGIHTDQLLHYLSKLVWVSLYFFWR